MTPVATQPPERTPVSALQPTFAQEPSSAQPGVILGSNTPRDLDEMIQIYARNVQEHGFSARTLLYYSSKPHEAKVKQYCNILLGLIQSKQIIPGDSLLDIGCGYGSFVEQFITSLKSINFSIEQFSYRGIDLVPHFIQYVQERFHTNGLIFENMDLATYKGQEDWSILLGVVNSIPNPRELVSQAFSKCRKGLLVDFNDLKKVRETKFNKFDIDVQIEYLRHVLGAQVEIYDEPAYAWTVLLAKH
jgi:SAM-dependent methyltransferase